MALCQRQFDDHNVWCTVLCELGYASVWGSRFLNFHSSDMIGRYIIDDLIGRHNDDLIGRHKLKLLSRSFDPPIL